MTIKSGNRGFTLVEMLIVFGLIAILSGYMMGSSFIASRQRARDAQRKADLSNLARNFELYVNDHNAYPTSLEIVFGDPFESVDGNTTYIAKLPTDLARPRTYVYCTDDTNPTAWQLYARLERTDDQAVDNNGDGAYSALDEFPLDCADPADPDLQCNYGISSSNTTPDTPLADCN